MKKITVLMATYNGERYIEEQINSILDQSYEGMINIFVRDDGSKDETIQVLERYSKMHNIEYQTGNNMGAFRNFMELISSAPESDYYAFSDQDDVWLEGKIKTAIGKIQEYDNIPCIYFSNNTPVNEKKEPINAVLIHDFSHADSLALSFVRNLCQGSTCIFNAELMKYLKKAPVDISFPHDWWTYIVCLTVGGKVITDENSFLLYRQHQNNVLGDRWTVGVRIRNRIKATFNKRTHMRKQMSEILLATYFEEISEDNKRLLYMLYEYMDSPLKWLKLLTCKEFYKAGKQYSLSFCIAVLTCLI